VNDCVADDLSNNSTPYPTLSMSENYWFLVRDVKTGDYESSGLHQIGLRGAEIAASSEACP